MNEQQTGITIMESFPTNLKEGVVQNVNVTVTEHIKACKGKVKTAYKTHIVFSQDLFPPFLSSLHTKKKT